MRLQTSLSTVESIAYHGSRCTLLQFKTVTFQKIQFQKDQQLIPCKSLLRNPKLQNKSPLSESPPSPSTSLKAPAAAIMASKGETQPDPEEEGKIPVFTVLKNGAILKNIFIVNKPPEPAPSPLSNPKTVASFQDHEDILIVGRHPDCNIMVTHPSISRFHLQIHSKPSSQKLSVIDLSSVHGTWVSDRKVKPGVSVDLKEGDTLKIGGSSRVYRLHWIPISRAYDLENPFISELDVAVEAEKAEEDAAIEDEKVETVQNRDFCAVDDEEMQSADSVMECIGSLFPDENLEVTVEKDFSSATSMPEDVIFSFDGGKSSAKDNDHLERKTFELSCGPFKSEISSLHLTCEVENDQDIENLALSPLQCDIPKSSLKIPEKMSGILGDLKSQSHVEEEHEAYPKTEKPQKTEVSSALIEYSMKSSCLPVVEAVQETNMRQADEIQSPTDSFTSQLLPSTLETFFENYMSNLLKNKDHAFFDEASAAAEVEVPAGDAFGYTLGKTDKVKDISTLEAGNLMTECICLPVEESNFDTRGSTLQCDNPESSLKIPEKMSDILVDLKSQSHVEEEHEAYSEAEKPQQSDVSSTSMEYLMESSSLPVVEAVQGTNMPQADEIQDPPDPFTSQLHPSKQETFFKNHKSNLLENTDHAFFDEASAAAEVEVPAGNEFGYTFEKIDKVIDISILEAKNPVTECISLPVEEANVDTRFQQVPFFKEQAALDSLSDGGEQDKDCKEHKLKLLVPLNMEACHEEGLSMVEFFQEIDNCWCLDSLFPISFPVESVNSSIPEEAASKESQTPQSLVAMSGCSQMKTCVEAKEKNSTSGNIWSRRGKAASAPQIRTSKSNIKSTVGADIKVDVCNEKDSVNKSISKDLSSILDGEEEEIFTPDKENFSPNTLQMRFLKNKVKLEVFTPGKLEEVKKSISKDHSSVLDGGEEEIFTPDKENLSPNTLQMRFLKNKGKLEEVFTPDKENFSPNTLQMHVLKNRGKLEKIKCSKSCRSHNSKANCAPSIYPENCAPSIYPENKSIFKDLSSVLDGEEEEIFMPDKENFSPNTLQMRFLKNKGKLREVFTPDKENFSPNTLQMQFLKKNKGKLEEIKCSESQRSHNTKANCAPSIYPDESISPTSNKENQTQVALEKLARRPFGSQIKLEQEQGTMALKNRVERVPFQSLLVNSGGKSRPEISDPVSAVKSVNADDCRQFLDKPTNPSHISREQKRNWDMIVDTASLLDRESRKALQLLQGLKGTRLIIPRMVNKELDSMKHQFSIFRRRSEASLALEWIEECMTKTKWWIHVQSTMEEGMLIAPTPPASPQIQFSKDSWTFPYGDEFSQPPSSCKSLVEIVSPTADDHILDFALLHRRKQKDGQLVLLSDDVTLKIKSMAEGLLCETVQEFRQSLVNPFSERFLWVNSSPRGLTWSCQDDVVLREKYSRFPSKKSVKGEGARGLKLILLHNSHYGHLSSAR